MDTNKIWIKYNYLFYIMFLSLGIFLSWLATFSFFESERESSVVQSLLLSLSAAFIFAFIYFILESIFFPHRKYADDALNLKDIVAGSETVGLERVVPTLGEFGSSSEWMDIMRNTTGSIDLMGRTLANWGESALVSDVILDKINKESVRFRWLIMDKDNIFIDQLNEGDQHLMIKLPDKLTAMRKFLETIQKRVPKDKESCIEIRYFKHDPLYFNYIRSDNRFFIAHYFCSRSSRESPMVVIKGPDGAWSSVYQHEFETLWRKSEPLLPPDAVSESSC